MKLTLAALSFLGLILSAHAKGLELSKDCHPTTRTCNVGQVFTTNCEGGVWSIYGWAVIDGVTYKLSSPDYIEGGAQHLQLNPYGHAPVLCN